MSKKFKPYEILHEDESIIVVFKSAGLLTIPDRYNQSLPNLYHILRDDYGKIFIVHRLDRDTSGLVLFAKDADSHRTLSLGFQNSEIVRKYHVIVSGMVSREQIDIDIPLKPDLKNKGLMKPSANGKESLTILKQLELFRGATLVECSLVTGRHHQIRAHCAAIGYPLLVDPDYGTNTEFKLSTIKRRYKIGKDEEEKPIINRLTMHARQLEFTHPASSEKVSFQAEYPKDFAVTVDVLRKYAGV